MSMSEPTTDDIGPETEIVVGETADGKPYTLPVEELLTGRLFATGKSGAGKSNTGSVIAEELLERGHPLLIVDVDDVSEGTVKKVLRALFDAGVSIARRMAGATSTRLTGTSLSAGSRSPSSS